MENTRKLSWKKCKRRRGSEKMYVDIYNSFVHEIVKKIGSNGETTDTQLDKIGKGLFKQKFAGVFAADTIPKSTSFGYCIANLDNADQPGEHWVAIVKNNGKYLVYDSFGRKTSDILPNLENVTDTDYDAEQFKHEENCGQRCLAWLLVYDQFGPDVARQI